ncbi:MAG: hypothetical protein NC217_04490 [Muribaculaceae bacterium]|nr:hypothetical protein [Muribaculaceae bacterium]
MTSTATYNTKSAPFGYSSTYRSSAYGNNGCAGMARSARRMVAGGVHDIAYTDCIYARLTLAGRVIVEFTKDRITDLSALLSQLRAMTPTRHGLAKLTIRNMTRGWRIERPLMLYADPCCPTESVCPMPYDY